MGDIPLMTKNATFFDNSKPVLTTDPWVDGKPYFGSWMHRYSIPKQQRENILKTASEVIIISEWTKKRFFQDLNYRPDDPKISVIYSSVNKKRFNRKKEKTILFVGL